MAAAEFDYVIIGSGFGGSVSALRLSEKGYKVLVIEKGRWYRDQDYAKSPWQLWRWLWLPVLGLRGIMKISIFRHVTVYSGVGVGGGSLTYGATLPTPKSAFFNTGSWAKLQDWQRVLTPFYQRALTMLGAAENPTLTDADHLVKDLAKDLGQEQEFHPARVGIYFDPSKAQGQFQPDPYFNGQGPKRKGCIQCGSCMTGCPNNAKNTLDKNYLHLAQQLGAQIQAETQVTNVMPIGDGSGKDGYRISCQSGLGFWKKTQEVRAKGVVFAAGVLGTVPLLLKLKQSGALANLSDCVGRDIRTNNETIVAVTSFNDNRDLSKGVAIGSVLHTDQHSHLEPIRYNQNSGILKLLLWPKVKGASFLARAASFGAMLLTELKANLKVLFSPNFGKRTLYLLFMQHLDSSLTLKLGRFGRLRSSLGTGQAPSCDIPASEDLTKKVEQKLDGKASVFTTEAWLGTPSTAHVLGGAVMAESKQQGVINDKSQVFGYHNMYVCDGSAISANPGVNPSLSITAITEWSMSHIADKEGSSHSRAEQE